MSPRNFLAAAFISSIVILTGCASADYVPPLQKNDSANYTKIVKRPYDEVWKDLIQYSAGTFFAIDNFEKDSGLITLTFGAGNPQEFITGGQWDLSGGGVTFHGDYVEYMSIHQAGKLNGKMNLVVAKVDESTTKITINARYIFTAGLPQSGINTWSFDSGSCRTLAVTNRSAGTPETRTICPTYKAEKAALSAL